MNDVLVARLVPTPRLHRIISRLLLAFGVGLFFLALSPWQQSVSGKGRVVAFAPMERQQEVEAPIEGRVTKWHVHEGTRVKRGDPLLELSDNDPEIMQRLREERAAVIARRDAAAARTKAIAARQRSLDAARDAAVKAAESRVAMSKRRSEAAEELVDAAEAAVKTSQLNVDRQQSLADAGLTSTRSLELATLEVIRMQTDAQRARVTLQAALGEEMALESDRLRALSDLTAAIEDARASEAAALGEEANAAGELARLEVRLARQSTMKIEAMTDGTVLRLRGGQGNEFVKAGEALMTLVPDTAERAVELWVDGNDMPLISEGREVRLQFEGWPAVQFTGWPSVAVGTFSARVVLIDATDDGTGRFRVLVKPQQQTDWPSGTHLRQGVRVNGWVLLERVTLGFEAWRRFNGFPPVVAPPSGTAAKKGS